MPKPSLLAFFKTCSNQAHLRTGEKHSTVQYIQYMIMLTLSSHQVASVRTAALSEHSGKVLWVTHVLAVRLHLAQAHNIVFQKLPADILHILNYLDFHCKALHLTMKQDLSNYAPSLTLRVVFRSLMPSL